MPQLPFQKWPMRARLYPGVAVSEATSPLGEQPPALRHLRSRLSPLSTSSSPYPLATHLGAPALQHIHTMDNCSDNSTGMHSENHFTADLNDAASYLNSGLSGTHTCLPPPYPAHCFGTWESEGAWGSDAMCNELPSCQPLTAYTGCWSSWQD